MKENYKHAIPQDRELDPLYYNYLVYLCQHRYWNLFFTLRYMPLWSISSPQETELLSLLQEDIVVYYVVAKTSMNITVRNSISIDQLSTVDFVFCHVFCFDVLDLVGTNESPYAAVVPLARVLYHPDTLYLALLLHFPVYEWPYTSSSLSPYWNGEGFRWPISVSTRHESYFYSQWNWIQRTSLLL